MAWIVPPDKAEEQWRAFLRRYNGPLASQLRKLWASLGSGLTLGQLQAAVAAGAIPEELAAAVQEASARYVEEHVLPMWAAATVAGSHISARIPGWTWAGGSQWLASYTRANAGRLITQTMTKETLDAIQTVLYHYIVEEPVTVPRLAMILRPMVGVTEPQAQAAIALRARLTEAGLKQSVIDKRVASYLARANRLRAETIATTETAKAYHSAQIASVREASRTGAIDGIIYKRWETASDELVCAACGPLHKKHIGLDEKFETSIGKTKVREFSEDTPPLHPRCRCTIVFTTKGAP